jgi:DNA ligase D-like protein (predicted 3'-phosphoesterase)
MITKTSDRLKKFIGKRDFSVTPEPKGGRAKRGRFPSFVIQKHAASRLHYDFRLEDEGVLKSWAVPKGPSMKAGEKRLAMPTEDHPMDYADFEGIIPQGQYGGGTVIVWDRGVFLNLTHKKDKILPLAEGIRHGHVRIWIEGKKIRGGFSLTRMGPAGAKTPWILVKLEDTAAGPKAEPVEAKPASVISKKTIEQMAKSKTAKTWRSNRDAS